MRLLEKVLVAVDFSTTSKSLEKNARFVSKFFNSKIFLVHVLPESVKELKSFNLIENSAREELDKISTTFEKEGLDVQDKIITYGEQCDRIVRLGERIGVNAIIIGYGEKKDGDYLLGSNACKIIKKSDKPIWVFRDEEVGSVTKIICPVDFTEASKRVLNNAIVIAHKFNAELDVLHVGVLDYSGFSSISFPYEGMLEYTLREASVLLDRFLEDFKFTNLVWRKNVAAGKPSKEILNFINKNNSNLLIIGSHGRSGINKLLMGSVASRVIRNSPIPFITMKSVDIIESSIESEITDIEFHYREAKKLEGEGLLQQALLQYKGCLELSQLHIPTLNSISKLYDKLESPLKAMKYKNRADEILKRLWEKKIEDEIRKYYKI